MARYWVIGSMRKNFSTAPNFFFAISIMLKRDLFLYFWDLYNLNSVLTRYFLMFLYGLMNTKTLRSIAMDLLECSNAFSLKRSYSDAVRCLFCFQMNFRHLFVSFSLLYRLFCRCCCCFVALREQRTWNFLITISKTLESLKEKRIRVDAIRIFK